tara:strand:+ start:593 stop:1165 length:573 start_codon:yes stop_codon:yes gene_type:complete
MNNYFWYEKPSILLENFFIIIPSNKYTFKQNLNSIVRFVTILSILCYIVDDNENYLYLIPLCLLITYLIYKYNIKEFFQNYEETVIKPTKENPVMNPTYFDYGNGKPLPIPDKTVTNKMIDDKILNNTYYDPGDTASQHLLQRNYYTIPSNDKQGELAKKLWDYPGCKKGDTEYCTMTLPSKHDIYTKTL